MMRAMFGTLLLLTGCASDYEISKSDANLGGDDTSAPPRPDAEEPEEEVVEGPVAVCEVSPNPVQPPFEEATWDGSGSHSNNAEIVEYKWSLEQKPTGSAVTMPGGTGAVRSGFMPDLAGDYIGRLQITDSNGEKDSCTVTLESVPIENLWIEMYWSERSDDMDLHLLAPGGRLESNTDCYFNNCVNRPLEWGQPGDQDNPILDLDDIDETGPENINIAEPDVGVYTVIVHDYVGSTWPDFSGTNQVTVNIYIDGQLKWTDTRGISGNGKYTSFAEIDWSTGSVTSL
jgi:hypothetical protein